MLSQLVNIIYVRLIHPWRRFRCQNIWRLVTTVISTTFAARFSSPFFLWCLQYLKLLPSHTYTHRCTCIPHSHNISGSRRYCILLHLGASGSECVLTGTANALWSWASYHRNWRSSTIREDVLSWWTVNPICDVHWRLRGSNDSWYHEIENHEY